MFQRHEQFLFDTEPVFAKPQGEFESNGNASDAMRPKIDLLSLFEMSSIPKKTATVAARRKD